MGEVGCWVLVGGRGGWAGHLELTCGVLTRGCRTVEQNVANRVPVSATANCLGASPRHLQLPLTVQNRDVNPVSGQWFNHDMALLLLATPSSKPTIRLPRYMRKLAAAPWLFSTLVGGRLRLC